MPSEMTAEEFHNLPSPSDLERGQNCGDDGQQECTLHNLHCGYPNCPKGHKENETVREVTTSLNAAEQAMAIRTAAEALVNALTKEPDDYDGLVYYEYAKELSNLQEALSHGWLARKEANPMCKCGVPLYLHGSLTACCLPRMTADDRERESLIGALQDRSRLDPDAPNALVFTSKYLRREPVNCTRNIVTEPGNFIFIPTGHVLGEMSGLTGYWDGRRNKNNAPIVTFPEGEISLGSEFVKMYEPTEEEVDLAILERKESGKGEYDLIDKEDNDNE